MLPWIKETEPYQIASDYIDYWIINGGFSNPTILINPGMAPSQDL
jgi:hypothetical protein